MCLHLFYQAICCISWHVNSFPVGSPFKSGKPPYISFTVKLWLIFFTKTKKMVSLGPSIYYLALKSQFFIVDYCSPLLYHTGDELRLCAVFIIFFAFWFHEQELSMSQAVHSWITAHAINTFSKGVCYNTTVRINVDKNACLTDQIVILNGAASLPVNLYQGNLIMSWAQLELCP